MFAQRIKALREERGISQAQLARDMDIMQSAVGNWEAGVRKPSAKKIVQLADYFCVTADYLLGHGEQDYEMVLLARRLKAIPEKDREFLFDNFKNTIDVYLKSKGH